MGLISWGDTTAAGIAARLPETSQPQTGDLVFFNGASGVVHVEMVVGQGSQTIGASGGGSQTFGDNPNAKVQHGDWNGDGRSHFFGSIKNLLAGQN